LHWKQWKLNASDKLNWEAKSKIIEKFILYQIQNKKISNSNYFSFLGEQ